MEDLRRYRPRHPDQFIGTAQHRWVEFLIGDVRLIRSQGKGSLKALLKGPPGIGKTEIARATAEALVEESYRAVSLLEESAADVDIDWVRALKRELHYVPMGGFKAIIVNEADLLPPKCQDLMLQVMDKLPDRVALLFTSNEDKLAKRFEDRCFTIPLIEPTEKEMREWMEEHITELSDAHIQKLSRIKGVRSALNQAQTCLMAQRKVRQNG